MHLVTQTDNLIKLLESGGFVDITDYGDEPSGKPVILQKEDITVKVDYTTLTAEVAIAKH